MKTAARRQRDGSETAARKLTFNQFVFKSEKSVATTGRMRWLSQICECWPLARLAAITEAEIHTILQSYAAIIITALDLSKPTLKP